MQSRRRGWDGQDYTYHQFMEWYGEESAMECWRAVDTPDGATQPVAAAPTGNALSFVAMQLLRPGWDGQDYTYAQFMEWYGEELANERWRVAYTPDGATLPVTETPTDNASDGATQPVAEAPTSNDPPVATNTTLINYLVQPDAPTGNESGSVPRTAAAPVVLTQQELEGMPIAPGTRGKVACKWQRLLRDR